MHAVRAELVERFGALTGDRTLVHSYLLVGKDTITLEATARAVQKAIDGLHRFNLADGVVLEIEGTSIGIDEIRETREHLATFPGIAPYRTALIVQAERMTIEAQNALLKLAEEPAPHSVLILATTDEERLLRTLRSRLQRVVCARLPDATVASWLVDEKSMNPAEAAQLAARSAGSLELAEELSSSSPERLFAQKLIGASSAQIAALAKEAATAEIRLPDLLRALSVELAYTEPTVRMRALWHRIQRLAGVSQTSPLSLRLQIAALFTDLPA